MKTKLIGLMLGLTLVLSACGSDAVDKPGDFSPEYLGWLDSDHNSDSLPTGGDRGSYLLETPEGMKRCEWVSSDIYKGGGVGLDCNLIQTQTTEDER